jgi:hypothetical protein
MGALVEVLVEVLVGVLAQPATKMAATAIPE